MFLQKQYTDSAICQLQDTKFYQQDLFKLITCDNDSSNGSETYAWNEVRLELI